MTAVYVLVFVVLVGVLMFRMQAAVRTLSSKMTWIAVLLAIVAMLASGTVLSIDEADAALGGANETWLLQCVLATFAFWAFSEAALSVEEDGDHRLSAWSFVAPVAWCVAFAIPFLLARDRGPTALHFSRVHALNSWVFISAVVYMAGICWMVARVIGASIRRRDLGYRLFILGAVLIILGCASETVVMSLVRGGALEMRTGWYLLFEVTFYPGVVFISVGMMTFSVRRRSRLRQTRIRADLLRRILTEGGIESPSEDSADDTYTVYALLVRITDHRVLGDLVLSRQDARLVDEIETWVEADLPNMLEATGPAKQAV